MNASLGLTFFGIMAVLVLCIATVRCAPISATSTPNHVPCQSTVAPTSSSSVLRQNALAFRDACINVTAEFENRAQELEDLADLNLPDITVFSDSLSGDNRLATHYFVLYGFRRPMEAVIIDEEEYFGTLTFDKKFQDLNQLLQTVTQSVQEWVCSNGAGGESQINAAVDQALPSRSTQTSRTMREYTVLYYMSLYARELCFDILRISVH